MYIYIYIHIYKFHLYTDKYIVTHLQKNIAVWHLRKLLERPNMK